VASRADNVLYTNNTTKLLYVSASMFVTGGMACGYVQGATVLCNGNGGHAVIVLFVPPGQTYRIHSPWFSSMDAWFEYTWN